MVKEAAEKAQSRQKGYYDQHAKKRVLSSGYKVLVLLPSSANKLKLEWAGPFLQHLRKVVERHQQAGLTVKLKYCFGQDHTCYLGHVIGGGEVQPDPEKVQAVQDYTEPRTKKDVCSFLGLAGYYQRFIPNFFYGGNSSHPVDKEGSI